MQRRLNRVISHRRCYSLLLLLDDIYLLCRFYHLTEPALRKLLWRRLILTHLRMIINIFLLQASGSISFLSHIPCPQVWHRHIFCQERIFWVHRILRALNDRLHPTPWFIIKYTALRGFHKSINWFMLGNIQFIHLQIGLRTAVKVGADLLTRLFTDGGLKIWFVNSWRLHRASILLFGNIWLSLLWFPSFLRQFWLLVLRKLRLRLHLRIIQSFELLW